MPERSAGRALFHRARDGFSTRTKLPAVADIDDRPIRFFMTAGQVNDETGAAARLGSLPRADGLMADRGHDADRFRDALKDKGIKPCIPGPKLRGKPMKHDKHRH